MSEIDAIVADAKRAYEIGDDDLGDELLRIADSKASEQTAPQQAQPEGMQQEEESFLKGAGEAALSILQPALSVPASGYLGLGALIGEKIAPEGGIVDRVTGISVPEGTASRIIEGFQEGAAAATAPEQQSGQDIIRNFQENPVIENLGNVINALNERGDVSGDFVYESTGSEGLATGIETVIKFVPDAFGVITGVKMGKPVGKAGSVVTQKAIPKVKLQFNNAMEKAVKSLSKDKEIKVFKDTGEISEEAAKALTPEAPTQSTVSPGDMEALQPKAPDVEAVFDAPMIDPELQKILTPQAAKTLNDAAEAGIDINTVVKNAVSSEGVALTPEMVDRFNLLARRDVPKTVADITQSTDDFKFRQEAIKSTGDVNQVVKNQNAKLAELARQGKADIAPTATDLAGVNDSLFNVVKDIADTADIAISDAYEAASMVAPDAKNIKLNRLVNEIQKMSDSDTLTGGTISAIKGHLKSIGLLDSKGKPVFKTEMSTDMTSKRGLPEMSVRDAENVRVYLNSLYDGANPQARKAIHDLKQLIDDDVVKVVGEDVFKDARQSVVDFHELVGRKSSNKFEKKTRSKIEEILTGQVKGDKIANDMRMNFTADEFGAAKDFYLNKSGDAGINAWNNFKANLFDEALQKAKGQKIGAIGEDTVYSFKGKDFKNYFDAMRNKRSSTGAEFIDSDGVARKAKNRLEETFTADEIQLIEDIEAIADITKSDATVGMGKGPSSQAISEASKRATRLIDMALAMYTKGLSEMTGANASGVTRIASKRKMQKLEKEFVQPEKLIEKAVKNRGNK